MDLFSPILCSPPLLPSTLRRLRYLCFFLDQSKGSSAVYHVIEKEIREGQLYPIQYKLSSVSWLPRYSLERAWHQWGDKRKEKKRQPIYYCGRRSLKLFSCFNIRLASRGLTYYYPISHLTPLRGGMNTCYLKGVTEDKLNPPRKATGVLKPRNLMRPRISQWPLNSPRLLRVLKPHPSHQGKGFRNSRSMS